MELWDIYNKNRELTGKKIVRGEKLNDEEYHLVVHSWIKNSNGQFLIQKRASGVKKFPNMWAATGGAAISGDDSYSTCIREVYEEIGIEADMDQANVIFTLTILDYICDVWLIKQDFDIDECVLQMEEVTEVKWASTQEIKQLLAEGEFHNYQYLDELFRKSVRHDCV